MNKIINGVASEYKIHTDGFISVTGGDSLKIYKGNVSIKTDETLYMEKLQQENKQLKEIIDKSLDWIKWFRQDNKEFYKNKIGLTMAELDGLENILKGDK